MRLTVLIAALLLAGTARAETVQVAVAANFSAPAKLIADDFARAGGHQAVLSFGATGKFYAQIQHGAPFEVLLAADAATPAKLVEEGSGLAASRFTYAIGQLALWSAQPGYVDERGEVLQRGGFRHLANANPKLAPYGAAGTATLAHLGLLETLQPRLVQAENIAQAHQFVASGNAELGFVALSQVMKEGRITTGSAWLVPDDHHQPIRQDALLLTRGRDNPAARAWLDHLRGRPARAVIAAFGYRLP